MRVGSSRWRNRPGLGGVIGLTCLAVVLPGCQLIGGGGPRSVETLPPSERQGGVVYHGSLNLDGGEMQAGLEIGMSGGREAWGALETTTGLRADGTGRVRGSTLELTLVYGGDCPGTLALEGEWDREAGSYMGAVEASDCTGGASGTFQFSAG